MAMRAKLLMDEFHAAHKAALEEDNYGAAMSFNSAENFVNNFLHGRTFEEALRSSLDDFDGRQFKSQKVWLNKLRNPNSIAFHTDQNGTHWLYIALTDKLVRYRYTVNEDRPTNAPETLAKFPDYGLNYKYGGWHLTRTIAIASNKL